MKYKNTSIPLPTLGVSFEGIIDEVVPDQSMSLKYILERFTRGESVPVGHETSEGEFDEDLEKLKHADLVDKAEFSERMEAIKKDAEKQEKQKIAKAKKAEADKLEAEIQSRIEKEVQKRTSGSGTT